jgi:acetyltransferase-like isoleucine patch superfamily enzyme
LGRKKNDNHQCEDYLNHNGNNVVNKDGQFVEDKPIIIESKVWLDALLSQSG